MVSIIIPAHNVAAFIGDAICSALAQSYPRIEVIVVDDGSTDYTPEVVRRFGREVRLIRQENAGPSAARNAGLAAARGTHVAFLDGDDAFDPTRIEVLLDALRDASPAAAFATTDARLWDGTRFLRRFAISTPVPGERDLSTFLDETWCYIGILARRDTLLAAGGFRQELRHCEDYDLWLRLLAGGKTYAYVPRPLYHYRVRESSLSNDTRQQIGAALRVEREALRTLPLSWGQRRQLAFLAWEDRARLHAMDAERARAEGRGLARGGHLAARGACHGIRAALRPGVCLSRLAHRGGAAWMHR